MGKFSLAVLFVTVTTGIPNLKLQPRGLHPGASKHPYVLHVSTGSCTDFWMISSRCQDIVNSKDYVLLDSASIGSQHSQLYGDTRLGNFMGPSGLGWEFPILRHVSCRYPRGDEESASWVAKAGKILLMEDIRNNQLGWC